uniref:Aminotransferase class I/classII domain-containing protein n=1 Tax=Glossina austeni TaxID=7395 RepID=A0A1A9UQK4_GLOAU
MIDLDVISQFHGLKIMPSLYYTTPTFHNPTGILFSDNVYQILIKLARKYDFLITCDDVDNVLHYQDEKPPIWLFVYDHCNAQKHIRCVHEIYKECMLAANLPKDCKMLQPEGDYFIWIRLPKQCIAAEFLGMCVKEEKIIFIAGPRFTAAQDQDANCFRLAIGIHTKEKIKGVGLRICQPLIRFLNK